MTASSAQTPAASRRPKAVHVSIVHRSTDIRIFHKQCRSLAAAGYDVTLYARTDGVGPDGRSPSGAGTPQPYTEDGVRVVPVPRHGSRVSRMTVGVWSLFRPLLAQQADVYHFHDPELIPLAIALRARGRKVIFDAHEPLPAQIMAKHWIPGPLRPLVARATEVLVRVAGRGMTAVVAASPLVAGVYAGAKRLATVNNFPILQDQYAVAGGDADIPYHQRTRGMVYVGGLSDIRGLATMLEVARIAGTRHGEKLTLIGPFMPPELEQRLEDPSLTDVIDYVGVKKPVEARQLIREARVGLILQIGPEAYKQNLPTKMFEYMAEGLPVVASHFPLWQGILDDAEAGVVVPPEDGRAAAEAVSRLLANPAEAADMGRRGRKAVHEKYSWEAEAQTLLSLYDSLLPSELAAARAR
ncbi:glycosyltransferase family 4 protein [Actinopolymorpha alba]|uniref:glycosyltransferase family 4 protein n=1 Tax=Actinopolymorpha alba TaxID=533267 RepID=UPI0007C7F80F|nr:glycosyltransferase family 4 protein [Actinopolymorpha alba]